MNHPSKKQNATQWTRYCNQDALLFTHYCLFHAARLQRIQNHPHHPPQRLIQVQRHQLKTWESLSKLNKLVCWSLCILVWVMRRTRSFVISMHQPWTFLHQLHNHLRTNLVRNLSLLYLDHLASPTLHIKYVIIANHTTSLYLFFWVRGVWCVHVCWFIHFCWRCL